MSIGNFAQKRLPSIEDNLGAGDNVKIIWYRPQANKSLENVHFSQNPLSVVFVPPLVVNH
jgi:hypothetical protein